MSTCDPELIETAMDDYLAQVEQAWERETGRALVRLHPTFYRRPNEPTGALRDAQLRALILPRGRRLRRPARWLRRHLI